MKFLKSDLPKRDCVESSPIISATLLTKGSIKLSMNLTSQEAFLNQNEVWESKYSTPKYNNDAPEDICTEYLNDLSQLHLRDQFLIASEEDACIFMKQYN